jgi:hypothetical protein
VHRELSDDQVLATGKAGLDSCIHGTTYPAVGFGDDDDDAALRMEGAGEVSGCSSEVGAGWYESVCRQA